MNDTPRYSKIPLWAFLLPLMSIFTYLGLAWDISWHSSIGRDSLLTPSHILMSSTPLYGILLFIFWFISKQPKDFGITLFGFTAPVGVWISFLASLIFCFSMAWDDWWHTVYGLDVHLESPPHLLISFSYMIIGLGNITILASIRNNISPHLKNLVSFLIIMYIIGLTGQDAAGKFERGYANYTHDPGIAKIFGTSFSSPLVVIPLLFPIWKWPSTIIALMFTSMWYLTGWTLQSMEAVQMLGPVFNPRDHMLPLALQFMVIPSAIAIDITRHYLNTEKVYTTLFLTFTVGFLVFIPVEWYYGSFMMSEYSHNWFFGGGQYHFWVDPTEKYLKEFWYFTGETAPTVGMYISEWFKEYLIAIGSCFVIYFVGAWIKSVKR